MSTVIKHKQFTNYRVYETTVAGRPLKIEVGKVAELANASAMVKYGETTVLVAVTVAPRPRDGVDFFPLSVDFEEKLYAVGRIPAARMTPAPLNASKMTVSSAILFACAMFFCCNARKTFVAPMLPLPTLRKSIP